MESWSGILEWSIGVDHWSGFWVTFIQTLSSLLPHHFLYIYRKIDVNYSICTSVYLM